MKSNLLEQLKFVGSGEKHNRRVIEVLNENMCQGWMQGYTLTGRSCIMIGYEAFMPIISSMVEQYAKWVYQSNIVPWRKKMSSMTYILTSVCWANTFSHQNPMFINDLLGFQYPFVRIYMPPDSNSLLVCMDTCLKSEDRINAIITTKQKMPQLLSLRQAQKGVEDGLLYWDWLSNNENAEHELILVAIGDYMVKECIDTLEYIKDRYKLLKIRFITVFELTSIGSQTIYSHAISTEMFDSIFTNNAPVIVMYHGYASAIKMLLYDRIGKERLIVLGYNNKSIYSCDVLEKLSQNGCSKSQLIYEIDKLVTHWENIQH